MPSGSTVISSFAISGSAVLYDVAETNQKKLIKYFVPTPSDKLADLPIDPSGSLLARTLTTPDNLVPFLVGTWKPAAWLHFEDDPVAAAAMFAEAGGDWVSQRTATVYQTRTTDTASAMLEKISTTLASTPTAQPTAPVAGLPLARCYQRTAGVAPPGSPDSWLRIAWPVKCAAAAQRWVFTVYAETISDAHQRISAQYRILSGQ